MLTHFRYTVAPCILDEMKAVKNETEIDGMKRAYARDGAAFVRAILLNFWIETDS
jgi:Xaa-Pro aminopeptidase